MLALQTLSKSSIQVLRHSLPNSYVSKLVFRSIATTSVKLVKEVKIEEEEEKITVEGVSLKSDRTDYLVPLDVNGKKPSCLCPLCRLDLKKLAYHFIESDGTLISQTDTSLCNRSYLKVKRMVNQAQKAKLLPRPPTFESFGPWDNLNRYFEYPKRIRDRPTNVIREEYWENGMR